MAPYLGSMDYMGARDAEEFTAAMRRWGAPGENQVYAAADGTIGWSPAGRVPVRDGWDGTLPVPGDGRYEWEGRLAPGELPSERDPEQGWFATANEMNLPPSWSGATVTHDWYAPYRHRRIAEVLGSRGEWSVEDCVRLQTDQVSLPARTVLTVLSGLSSDDRRVEGALAMLRGWDARLSPESAPGALFEIWYRRHLRPALLRAALSRLLPAEQVERALVRVLPAEDAAADPRVDLGLLLEPGDRLGPDPSGTVRGILLTTLADAVDETEGLLGEDPGEWRWGRLHRGLLRHPLAGLGLLDDGAGEPEWATVGPAPRGGSGDTVGAAAYTSDFRQSTGATFRIVVDVGDWDRSVAMNSPGQSGDPSSPHHHDLFARWAADEAFPLLYSRAAVEENTVRRLTLRPAAGAGPRPGRGPASPS
jgi:penicillin amidase